MARNLELENKIIELYNSGLSMAKVGKEVNKSAATVLHVLQKNQIPTRTHGGINKLPAEEILDKYLNQKRTLKDISKDYGVTLETIRKVILDNGGQIRTSAESKNPYFIKNYFKNIDTEAKAYFLGFLITDGCVSDPDIKNNHPNNRIRLEVQEQDAYILESFKNELKLTNSKLYQRVKENSVTKTLCWYSTEMANDLSQYGVVPRKTLTTFLPNIDEKLMSHLIRGLIDGDGWITEIHTRPNKSHLVIGFCGSEQCVTQLRDYLVNRLNIYPVKVIQNGINLWQVSWASQKDVKKIGDFIYQDANFYLTRKFNKYYSINENTEVTC